MTKTAVPAIVADLDAAATKETSPCAMGRMVWRIWGEGPPVLLLHGGYGSWTHWVRNITPLARDHTVIAPDLPGLGDSASVGRMYSEESLTDILTEGFDQVFADRPAPTVVGFSFGGLLGGLMAARRHDRIARMVVVGATALGLPRDELEELGVEKPGLPEEEARAIHRRNLEILMIADPANIDELSIDLQMINRRRARVRSRKFARADALAVALRAMSCPIAGIWGELDSTATPYVDQRRELFQEIQPGSPFHVIPGAGHWVQYEAADAFNAALLDIMGS